MLVDSALLNGEIIESDVVHWMARVEVIEANVQFLLATAGNKRLFGGRLKDANISTDILMSYGMGLTLFKNVDSLNECRFRLHAIVDHLKASSLLLDGVDRESLQMHDIIQDVAISITSKYELRFLVKTGAKLHKWPIIDFEYCTAISLRFKVIHEVLYEFECPFLQILVLECSHLPLKDLETFFQGMRNLKVLHLCGLDIPSLPISIRLLVGL
ncbi:hypothetical protein F0562_025964 [Nyssa sinensis]|uniref:Uncharacterized protein n=1 Tax=Nyssa sinensis TaxID=561372 RepID=A0A5J5BBP1_9ASTE|nr:hypothetical protein F0562_025964 [Nyssa sinensis]